MARHCGESHGLHTYYLRHKDREPERPYRLDWKTKLITPGKIWMKVPDHHWESESDHINTQEATGAPLNQDIEEADEESNCSGENSQEEVEDSDYQQILQPNQVQGQQLIAAAKECFQQEFNYCSVGTQKDMEPMPYLCGKRMRVFNIKNKLSLLSPTASQRRLRHQMWSHIARVQTINLRELKRLNKTQEMQLLEQAKENQTMRGGLDSTYAGLQKLKSDYRKQYRQETLKTAREEGEKAKQRADQAEEKVKILRKELEEMK